MRLSPIIQMLPVPNPHNDCGVHAGTTGHLAAGVHTHPSDALREESFTVLLHLRPELAWLGSQRRDRLSCHSVCGAPSGVGAHAPPAQQASAACSAGIADLGTRGGGCFTPLDTRAVEVAGEVEVEVKVEVEEGTTTPGAAPVEDAGGGDWSYTRAATSRAATTMTRVRVGGNRRP